MPFKVTNFGTNGKPICNFLLVINTNLQVTSYLASYGRLLVKVALSTWVHQLHLSLTHLFGVNP